VGNEDFFLFFEEKFFGKETWNLAKVETGSIFWVELVLAGSLLTSMFGQKRRSQTFW